MEKIMINRGFSEDALSDLIERSKTNPEEYYKFCFEDKEVILNLSPYFYAYESHGTKLKYGYYLVEKPLYHIKLLNVDCPSSVRPNLGRFRYSYFGNYEDFGLALNAYKMFVRDVLNKSGNVQMELF